VISTRQAAVQFLDDRIGQGVKPGLERIEGALELLGHPQGSFPVVHVAGTNGKTTTVRMIRDLLGAHGLLVGSFVSPHLHRIEGRYTIGGRTLTSEELVQGVADVEPFVEAFEERRGEKLTYFEMTTLLALSMLATVAVDVGVIEVGLGGRLDATNVVEADVSVVTGIAMDHMAYLGNSISAIAGEKAAILKTGGTLVTGPLDPAAEGPITARVAETGSRWFRYGDAYSVTESDWEDGAWHISIDGIYGGYHDLTLGLHGRHQVDHLALAIAATELFFGRALDADAVEEACAQVTSPGRIEVASRRPLIVVDGAHNEQGIAGLADALRSEFPPADWVLVTGWRGDRDIAKLMAPVVDIAGSVVATMADDPEAVPAAEVAAAAARLDATMHVEETSNVVEAIEAAKRIAGDRGAIVVAGSLYVAGEARQALGLPAAERSVVHRRFEPVDDDEIEFDLEDIDDDLR
jgi:dihydrofolate synthase / folylpolyglutamate synthase